jgi:hypothetical protein
LTIFSSVSSVCLEDATYGFLEGNTAVNKVENSISVSMLFKWYKEDFGGSDLEIIQWLKTRSPKELAQSIAEMAQPELKYPAYNWSLNTKE